MEPDNAIQVIDLTKFYWAVGALIITNIGAVGSFVVFMFKIYGKAVEWKTTVEINIRENTKDINAAHKAIRDIKL